MTLQQLGTPRTGHIDNPYSAVNGRQIKRKINPFRGEEIERMPEKVNYIITTVVTAGIVP